MTGTVLAKVVRARVHVMLATLALTVQSVCVLTQPITSGASAWNATVKELVTETGEHVSAKTGASGVSLVKNYTVQVSLQTSQMDNARSTPKRRTIQMGIVHGQTSAVDQHKGTVMFILANVSANLGFMESIAHNVVLVMVL